MAIEYKELINLTYPLVKSLVQRVGKPTKQHRNVGTIRFGESEAYVEIKLNTGRPRVVEEYLSDIAIVEAFKFYIYMKHRGIWVKRIDSGVILLVDILLDRPSCRTCNAKLARNFQVRKSLFRTFRECRRCGTETRFMSPEEMTSVFSRELRNMVNNSLSN